MARKVQFMFDDKLVEFEVEWSPMQLASIINDSVKDDGFLWVKNGGDGPDGCTFVNLGRCTCIRLFDDEPPAE